MQEKTLLKIASAVSLIGIVLLFFISESISVQNADVWDVSSKNEGNDVKITGRIEKVSDTGKVIFLEIGQEKIESVEVILFKDSDIVLNKGEHVEITGEVTEYEGKKEVIANKVRIV